MSKRLKYFCIHCTDTPKEMEVTNDMIEEWHKSPKDLYPNTKNTTVRFDGITYSNRNELPDVLINNKNIKDLKGNGWRKVGYSIKINRDGIIDILNTYNDDEWVTWREVTYGAVGINDIARHIVLVGGWKNNKERQGTFKIEDVFTAAQFVSLQRYLKEEIYKHKDIKIGGHYNFNKKTCPNFDVQDYCKLIKIPKNNIY